MRRPLGPAPALAPIALIALVLLGGCGSRSATPGADTETSRPTRAAGATQVALVSQTAAGGRVSAKPVRLDAPAAVGLFTAQFRGAALTRKVAAAVRRADVPADRVLLGAVVALGCDVPPGVRVVHTGAGVRIVALPVRSPLQECFAPVTTVAIVSVPAAGL